MTVPRNCCRSMEALPPRSQRKKTPSRAPRGRSRSHNKHKQMCKGRACHLLPLQISHRGVLQHCRRVHSRQKVSPERHMARLQALKVSSIAQLAQTSQVSPRMLSHNHHLREPPTNTFHTGMTGYWMLCLERTSIWPKTG